MDMDKKTLSRRQFLKGAAATALTSALVGVAGMDNSRVHAEGIYNPGTYSAEALGMGRVVVTMTFDENSITDVKLDLSHETDTLGQLTGPVLKNQIIAAQSGEIDGVSSATATSTAVRKAVELCIAQAKGMPITVTTEEGNETISAAELADSECCLAPIGNAEDGGSYDIIVIGAGTAGVPCAVRAAELGLKVLVLQKEAKVVSQGNTCTGIVLADSE